MYEKKELNFMNKYMFDSKNAIFNGDKLLNKDSKRVLAGKTSRNPLLFALS